MGNMNKKRLMFGKYISNIIFFRNSQNHNTTGSSIMYATTGKETDLMNMGTAIETLQKDLLWMRIRRAQGKEFKPSDMKIGKREIARLLKLRKEKQMEFGISENSYNRGKMIKLKKSTTLKLMRGYQVKRIENP